MVILQMVVHEAKPLPPVTMIAETQCHKSPSNRGRERWKVPWDVLGGDTWKWLTSLPPTYPWL